MQRIVCTELGSCPRKGFAVSMKRGLVAFRSGRPKNPRRDKANIASSMFSTNSSASTLKNISSTEVDWMTQQNMVMKKRMPTRILRIDENKILGMLNKPPAADGTCSIPFPIISRDVGISCSFNTAIRIATNRATWTTVLTSGGRPNQLSGSPFFSWSAKAMPRVPTHSIDVSIPVKKE